MRADGGGHVAGGLDRDAPSVGDRQERLSGFFRQQGQVDAFSSEGPLVGAAEHEQRFGEGEATMCAATSSPEGPGMSRSRTTIGTRILRCYEPEHVVGISKTTDVPATSRSLD